MSFFKKWTRPVRLPATPERRLSVGKNAVTQTAFHEAVVSADFFESQHSGHDLIKTTLSAPFDEMLVRFPKAHRVTTPLPVLTCADPEDYKQSSSPLELTWDRLGDLESWADTPDKVLSSWRNKFVFAVEDLEAGHPGLRLPQIESWPWRNIPLNRESMGKTRATDTIQHYAFQRLKAEFDLVFNDDGSGEAADLVGLKEVDEKTIRLCLIHCKNAHKGVISQDIQNFYVLCGQAQKSVTVKHHGMSRLYNDLKRRHELWMKDGHSRFLKGDIKQLAYFRDKSRRTALEFEVIIAQPGASAADNHELNCFLLANYKLRDL
jgi:hypothetical protein